MTAAVLVIDVQQGLCEGDGRAWDSDAVIARINAVTHRARAAGVPVLFIQHESGPGYLEHGTRAWELAKGLQAPSEDARVRKTTPDSFLHTDLQERLRTLDVSELVVCGMHSEFCVDTTTRSAAAHGYHVVLASDAHTTHDKAHADAAQIRAHHNATLPAIRSFGVGIRALPAAEIAFTG